VAGRWRALAALSLAELLALSLWFSASAVLPALSREWSLGSSGRASLTIAVQLGFIAGTLASALGNLPDVWSPRSLMIAASSRRHRQRGARAHRRQPGARRWRCASSPASRWPEPILRDEDHRHLVPRGRGLAIGILIGALTVGSATPHLIRGVTDLPWRETLLAASGLAAIAALIVWLGVSEGPHRFPPARFDVRMAAAVFTERPLRLACFGYFGHMWELYAMWAWLGVFFAASLAARGAAGYAGLNASLATFVAMAAGAAGCYAGGIVSDRWGRTTLTMAAMALSGTCALLIGLTFGGPRG